MVLNKQKYSSPQTQDKYFTIIIKQTILSSPRTFKVPNRTRAYVFRGVDECKLPKLTEFDVYI